MSVSALTRALTLVRLLFFSINAVIYCGRIVQISGGWHMSVERESKLNSR